MANQVVINTSTSIVDFLKSVNKPSDYSSREKLYNEIGLGDRLGTYTGSSTQNIAFLKQLQSGTTGPSTAAPTTPSTVVGGTLKDLSINLANQQNQPAPTTATDALSAFGINPSVFQAPSQEDLLGKALQSPEFTFASERINARNILANAGAAAQKEGLASKSAADTKSFITSMGRRGLFFSGETETGIQSLAASLAASQLGVDRELAGKLLESDFDLRDAIFKQVEKVATDAKNQRKEALDALEKAGLTIVGNQVLPTIAAQNLALSEQRESRIETQQQLQNELNQAKFELSQAKTVQQMEIATARLELAQARAERAEASFSAADRRSQAALSLYGDRVRSVLAVGGTPEDALAAAVDAATESFVTLGVEEQNAILTEAQRLLGSGEIETLKPEENPLETIPESFFSRFFNLF